MQRDDSAHRDHRHDRRRPLQPERDADGHRLEQLPVPPRQHDERGAVQKIENDQREDGDVQREADLAAQQKDQRAGRGDCQAENRCTRTRGDLPEPSRRQTILRQHDGHTRRNDHRRVQ